jgi:general secretion pathway protein G
VEFHIVTGNRRRGFTLIELLVVMVIIASLLTIAVPRYFRSMERSKEVVLAQDLAVMRDAIDKFYSDRGQYPETLQALAAERYIRAVPVDPITKTADSWVVIQNTEDPDVTGIVDVHSGADALGSNGVAYDAW